MWHGLPGPSLVTRFGRSPTYALPDLSGSAFCCLYLLNEPDVTSTASSSALWRLAPRSICANRQHNRETADLEHAGAALPPAIRQGNRHHNCGSKCWVNLAAQSSADKTCSNSIVFYVVSGKALRIYPFRKRVRRPLFASFTAIMGANILPVTDQSERNFLETSETLKIPTPYHRQLPRRARSSELGWVLPF